MKLLFLTVILVFSVSGKAEGPINSGGDDTTLSNTRTIEDIITNKSNLKHSLIHYLQTLSIDKISNSKIKSFFSLYPGITEFIEDIEKSEYQTDQPCFDRSGENMSASAQFGIPGSNICFDLQKLNQELQGLSYEEKFIHLGAIAMHEHMHHFQALNRDGSNKLNLEIDADLIYVYVLKTAKVANEIILKWEVESDSNPQFNILSTVVSDFDGGKIMLIKNGEDSFSYQIIENGQTSTLVKNVKLEALIKISLKAGLADIGTSLTLSAPLGGIGGLVVGNIGCDIFRYLLISNGGRVSKKIIEDTLFHLSGIVTLSSTAAGYLGGLKLTKYFEKSSDFLNRNGVISDISNPEPDENYHLIIHAPIRDFAKILMEKLSANEN